MNRSVADRARRFSYSTREILQKFSGLAILSQTCSMQSGSMNFLAEKSSRGCFDHFRYQRNQFVRSSLPRGLWRKVATREETARTRAHDALTLTAAPANQSYDSVGS
jgi:hypothetical protein